jgi:hypothetical protein
MESQNKATLLNAAWGKWYPTGSDRLKESLVYHGWAHHAHIWKDDPINEWFNPEFPYTIKAAAWSECLKKGYTHLFWADSSVWCVQNPTKIMDIIHDEGGYFWYSGYNLAQTATDKDLEFAGWTRDFAETLPEIASNMFGVNISNPKGQVFSNVFLEAAKAGVFNSSREHNNASNDPRFLFGRQDQVAATIAYHKASFDNARHPEVISSYYEPNKKLNPTVLFVMQGL